jgi:hypothetical protein
MRTKRQFLRFFDLTLVAGFLGIAALIGVAVEAGRAFSVAVDLKTTVTHAGQLALQTYAERRDPDAAREIAESMFAADAVSLADANLTDFAISDSEGTLRLTGTVPVDIRILVPFGFGRILVDHKFVAPLPLERVAVQAPLATP